MGMGTSSPGNCADDCNAYHKARFDQNAGFAAYTPSTNNPSMGSQIIAGVQQVPQMVGNALQAAPGAIIAGTDMLNNTAGALNNTASAINNTAGAINNTSEAAGKLNTAFKPVVTAASAAATAAKTAIVGVITPGVEDVALVAAVAARKDGPGRYVRNHNTYHGGTCAPCGQTRGGYFGGDETADPAKGLREYESSIAASAKEGVIRRLARALQRAGIDVDPDNDDLDKIIMQLVTQIPHPKNGKTFSSDAKSQEKVCQVIAGVLNDEFTPGVSKAHEKFIDTSLSAGEICRMVGEWGHSFSTGVNTEFLAVHASVKNALRTVEILGEIMKELYDKIRLDVETSGSSKLTRRFDPLNEVYTRAQRERKRQEELLKNILHVQLAPAAKELEIAMRDESEQHTLIKKLGLKPGTSDFADSLAMAVSGLGTSAAIAHRVHKALKLVGFSVQQYLESNDFAEFQELLDARVEDGKIPAKDLAKFLEAVETLQHSFSHKDDTRFSSALAEASGGRRTAHGGDDVYDDDDKRTKVEQRVEKRETEKKVILRDFAKRMARHYDELLAAVKAIGPKLGREIPLTDRTDSLNEALKRLSALGATSNRIELALIGMFMGAQARERKERFVNSLRMVSGSCNSIMELEMYRASSGYFAHLKKAIDAIEKTIDYFADVIKNKYGVDGGGDDDNGTTGGAPVDIADYLPEIASSGLNFNAAVGEFVYYYYVAKVHVNLEQTSKELDTYGEKYVELLGDAVASRIYSLNIERKTIMDKLATLVTGDTTKRNTAYRATAAGGVSPFPDTAEGNTRYTAVVKWIDDEYNIKIKFYNALQAVDLYLKAFTIALTKDPDAVRDIKGMLDETQVIARWFSEQTGDSIWQAFEHMGSVLQTGARTAPAAAGFITPGDSAHYYEGIHDKMKNAATAAVGMPQVGVDLGGDLGHGLAAKKSISSAVDHFQALKNIINAFSRIGDKFGGRELRTQIFMSPSQIFKNLSDYLKLSALSINSLSTGDPVDIMSTTALTPPNPIISPWEVYFGSVDNHGNYGPANIQVGNFGTEDKYFTLIIKGMAAKILTTLGVYDMFERTSPVYDLTPTRMIVGGADDFAPPEVLDGAAELYFRLPRLAEFYRQFLRWDGYEGDPNPQGFDGRIAMLPELEGIFSGLIRLIFRKAVSSENGDYSDSEMRALVRESNLIYEHFREKHGDRAPQEALSAFVMEINRRYGIIKRKDMQEYMAMVKKLSSESNYGDLNNTNYAILPGEGDAEVDRRPPSDYFKVQGDAAAAASPYIRRIGLDHEGALGVDGRGRHRMLREFRAKFDKQFELLDPKTFNHTSYTLLIKQAAREIQSAQTRESKFQIAARLIQGTSISGTDTNKAVMFHETVVVGLNVLSSFETLLRNFNDSMGCMDPCNIECAIMKAFLAIAATGSLIRPVTKVALEESMIMQDATCALTATTTKYTDYIIAETAQFYGRNGIPVEITAGNVLTFINSEIDLYIRDLNLILVAFGATTVNMDEIINSMKPGGTTPTKFNVTAGGVVRTLNTDDVNERAIIAAINRLLRAVRLTARLLVDYNKIMVSYVENLFDLMSGSKNSDMSQALVDVRMSMNPSIGIQLSFAKLRDNIEKIMSDVKHFFEIFRTAIPRETIDRFEKIENSGSVFWIEKHLIDEFLRGAADDTDEERTLEGLARRVTKVYTNLLRDTKTPLSGCTLVRLIDGDGDIREGCIPENSVTDATCFENYGQAFSSLIFYNAVNATSDTMVADATAIMAAESLILTARPSGGPALGRYGLYSDRESGMTTHRSLLFAYNQLVASYLKTLIDSAGGKRIYLNLINSFANGAASMSVTNPNGSAFPDLAAPGAAFGFRGDPKSQAVLFQSLAWKIQRLIKDVSPTTQVPDHLVTTLTDVPIYMKEGMRASLPAYIKLFDILAQKGDFIKSIMQKTSIDLTRPSQTALSGGVAGKIILGVGDVEDPLLYSINALNALESLSDVMPSDNMRARISPIIDAIIAGTFAISSSASETLKELGDSPIYFQTQENSIEQYRMRYGKMPLMPLSTSLYLLNDLDEIAAFGLPNDLKLFPGHVLGTPNFKFMYGTRQLIMRSTPVVFDQVPGVKALLDSYNGVSSQQEQIDDSRYLQFIQTTVSALRYIAEARNLKSSLSGTNMFSAGTLIAGAGNRNGIVTSATGNAAYSIKAPYTLTDINSVLALVESSNQDEEIHKITDRVTADSSRNLQNRRELERINNIVDMNIIPINVHALMRDTPLANLYNYEYTFEQMVASIYGEQAHRFSSDGSDGQNRINDDNTKSTRRMFLRLLVDPYMKVNNDLYGSGSAAMVEARGFVHRIFRGDNDLGMGRPKFLSDQLFNKALFGSIYQSKTDYDEAGPSTGIGITRGRDMTSNPYANVIQALNEIIVDHEGSARALAAVGTSDKTLRDIIITLRNNNDQATNYIAAIPNILRGIGPNVITLAATNTVTAARRGTLYSIYKPAAAGGFIRLVMNQSIGAATAAAGGDPAAIAAAVDDAVNAAADGNAIRGAATAAGIGIAVLDPANQATVTLIADSYINYCETFLRAKCDILTRLCATLNRDIVTALGAADLTNIAGRLLVTAVSNAAVNVTNPLIRDRDLISYESRFIIQAIMNTSSQNQLAPDPKASSQRITKLTYLSSSNDDAMDGDAGGVIKEITIPRDQKIVLDYISKMRFDTRFIRNIFFITNVVRILRLKLNRELTQSRNVLVSSHMSVAAGVTEYGSDPFGPNEVYDSRSFNRETRYNDGMPL